MGTDAMRAGAAAECVSRHHLILHLDLGPTRSGGSRHQRAYPAGAASVATAPAPDGVADAQRLSVVVAATTDSGHWSDAMAALGRSRALLEELGVAREARLAGRRRADSLAAVIEQACPSVRAMLLKRGETPPACPVRPW